MAPPRNTPSTRSQPAPPSMQRQSPFYAKSSPRSTRSQLSPPSTQRYHCPGSKKVTPGARGVRRANPHRRARGDITISSKSSTAEHAEHAEPTRTAETQRQSVLRSKGSPRSTRSTPSPHRRARRDRDRSPS